MGNVSGIGGAVTEAVTRAFVGVGGARSMLLVHGVHAGLVALVVGAHGRAVSEAASHHAVGSGEHSVLLMGQAAHVLAAIRCEQVAIVEGLLPGHAADAQAVIALILAPLLVESSELVIRSTLAHRP